MPELKDEELFRHIKQGDIKSVYFLYGAEDYFISACVDLMTKSIVAKGSESFNLVSFIGEKLSMNELEEAVESMPMMADRKCVLLKDLDFEKLSKADLEQLLALISNPNETTVLIIYTTNIVYDIKKSTKAKQVFEQVKKTGVVCEFAYKDKPTIKRALVERAKKAGITLEMPVADFLIDRCSSSYTVLLNELDKLIHYVSATNPNGVITKQAIEECSTPSIESNSFDLAKSILNKRYEKAFLLLDELFYQRVEPIAILSALSMSFIDLYRAKVALGAGKSIEQAASDFNYPKNRLFAVKNAFRDTQSYSAKQLRYCLDRMINADVKLKSSKMDNRLILEVMLASMIQS